MRLTNKTIKNALGCQGNAGQVNRKDNFTRIMLYKLDTQLESMRCILAREVVTTRVNHKVSHGVSCWVLVKLGAVIG